MLKYLFFLSSLSLAAGEFTTIGTATMKHPGDYFSITLQAHAKCYDSRPQAVEAIKHHIAVAKKFIEESVSATSVSTEGPSSNRYIPYEYEDETDPCEHTWEGSQKLVLRFDTVNVEEISEIVNLLGSLEPPSFSSTVGEPLSYLELGTPSKKLNEDTYILLRNEALGACTADAIAQFRHSLKNCYGPEYRISSVEPSSEYVPALIGESPSERIYVDLEDLQVLVSRKIKITYKSLALTF